MAGYAPQPPWGVDVPSGQENIGQGGGGGGRRGGGGGGGANPYPAANPRDVQGGSLVLAGMGPGPLQDRNVIVDEMYQLKKEVRLAQMEARRMGEELAQRLGVVDGRLQAGEQNLRTLDKREAGNTNMGQQGIAESDLKMREVVAEMGRFKRQVEAEMRGVVEGIKSELRQREGIIQQLDITCRGLALQIKAGEESRAGADRDMKAAVERRFQQMQDSQSRQEQQFLDRGVALERVLQREADERAAADAQVRQELDSALQAIKGLTSSEAGARLLIHKELRQQIGDTSKALHEQVVLVREEADRGRQALADSVADEKVQRELVTGVCQRKVDNFIRLYEVERQRLDKGVKDALAQILERTRSVQALSKRMQEEGTDLRRIAGRVQDESSVAVRALSETVEDSLRLLTSTQDRHTQQILDLRSAHNVDTQETRDRLAQALAKVQGEIDKNFREDRQAREGHAQRMHEWSEQVKSLDKGTGGRLAALEQALQRDVQLARREADDARHAGKALAAELLEDLEEHRKRVAALEAQTETALQRALGEMRAAQSQAQADTLDAKSLVRGLVTTATGTMRAHATRIGELERVLRLHQGRMEEVLSTGEALATSGAVLDAAKVQGFDGPEDGGYSDEEFDEPGYGEQEERAAVKIQAVARGSRERKAITGAPGGKVADVEYEWPGKQGGGGEGLGGVGDAAEEGVDGAGADEASGRSPGAESGSNGLEEEELVLEDDGPAATPWREEPEAASAGSGRGAHDAAGDDKEEPTPDTPGDDDFYADDDDGGDGGGGGAPGAAGGVRGGDAPVSGPFERKDSEVAASEVVASMVRGVSETLSSEGSPSLPVSRSTTAGAQKDAPPPPQEAPTGSGQAAGGAGEGAPGAGFRRKDSEVAAGEVVASMVRGVSDALSSEGAVDGAQAPPDHAPDAAGDAKGDAARPQPSDADGGQDAAAPRAESAGAGEGSEQLGAGSGKQSPEGSAGDPKAQSGEGGEAAPSAAASSGEPTPAPESVGSAPTPAPESAPTDGQSGPLAAPESENSVPTPAPESDATDPNNSPTPAPESPKSEQKEATGDGDATDATSEKGEGGKDSLDVSGKERVGDQSAAGDADSTKPPSRGGGSHKTGDAGSDPGSKKPGDDREGSVGSDRKGSDTGSDEKGSDKGSAAGSDKKGTKKGSDKKGTKKGSDKKPSEGEDYDDEGDFDFDDEDAPELPM